MISVGTEPRVTVVYSPSRGPYASMALAVYAVCVWENLENR